MKEVVNDGNNQSIMEESVWSIIEGIINNERISQLWKNQSIMEESVNNGRISQ